MKEGPFQPVQWFETKVTVTSPNMRTVLDLVAQCFLDLGVKGVVVKDPRPPEPEADWIVALPEEPEAHAVIGYFRDDATLPENCRRLETNVQKVSALFSHTGVHIDYRRIDEEDWSHSWKAFFKPLTIGKTLIIKPTWCEYTEPNGRNILTLDPGMAFGTGTHPTTVMCMEMIEKTVKPKDAVLDIGTGTGVLLIAAALSGAATGDGIDCDPMAVDIARRNLALNGIDPAAFTVNQGDLAATLLDTSMRYDLVVANILANAIAALLPDLGGLLRTKGTFIASGLLVPDEIEMIKAMEQYGFAVSTRWRQKEWLCLAAQKAE